MLQRRQVARQLQLPNSSPRTERSPSRALPQEQWGDGKMSVFICHIDVQVTKPRGMHLGALTSVVVLKRHRKLGECWKSISLQGSWTQGLLGFKLYYIELGKWGVITML